MHHQQSNEAGKRRTRGPEPAFRQVLKPRKPGHLPPVDTPKGRHERPPPAPTFQKYIKFLPFVVSQFTRVRQKQANKCLLLPCFRPDWLVIRHDGRQGGRRTQGVPDSWSRKTQGAEKLKECKTQGAASKRMPFDACLLSGECAKRDTPPLFWGEKSFLPP